MYLHCVMKHMCICCVHLSCVLSWQGLTVECDLAVAWSYSQHTELWNTMHILS